MYDHTFYKQVQISKSDIRPHIKWAVSLVILQMITSIFPGLCVGIYGIYIRYRLDGSLFDLRRLRAQTKSVERLIVEALFADDCSLLAHSEADLQAIVNKFAEATHQFELTISIKKTEVLHQPSPAQRLPPPSINIDGSELKNVDQFKYLGSIMSSDGTHSKEIESRINKVSQPLGRLRFRVMDNWNIKLSTKLKVYKAVVLTSLLYGWETWTLYRKQIKQLEGFHMRSLRRIIIYIRWQDKVTNLQVLDRANAVSIEALLFKAQLRWTGHVIRMDASRMPRQILCGELVRGTRKKGRPKKWYKDCIKETLKQCSLPPRDLETCSGQTWLACDN